MTGIPFNMSREAAFFAKLDQLCSSSEFIVDRPKASRHPRIPDAAYPVDYGYLGNTTGGDGEGVDVFRGSAVGAGVVGVFLTADLVKRDVEVKVLLDCADSEIEEIGRLLHVVLEIGGMLVRRPTAE
ncbi:inorganic pyrophosphatase-related protein [Immersiella caudata]|uniref:Inorganic pyrophosphatase-related protein n=1 Tax=Immersiella caudata TaxID=314043 RepID=A0AA40C5V8_9PEZI|nr:inorganic pyrophosphatase-related protein [Immersiella caudata]